MRSRRERPVFRHDRARRGIIQKFALRKAADGGDLSCRRGGRDIDVARKIAREGDGYAVCTRELARSLFGNTVVAVGGHIVVLSVDAGDARNAALRRVGVAGLAFAVGVDADAVPHADGKALAVRCDAAWLAAEGNGGEFPLRLVIEEHAVVALIGNDEEPSRAHCISRIRDAVGRVGGAADLIPRQRSRAVFQREGAYRAVLYAVQGAVEGEEGGKPAAFKDAFVVLAERGMIQSVSVERAVDGIIEFALMRRKGGNVGNVRRLPREELPRTGIPVFFGGKDGHAIVESAVEAIVRVGKQRGGSRYGVRLADLFGTGEGDGRAVAGDSVNGGRTACNGRRKEGIPFDEEGGAGDARLDFRPMRRKAVEIELRCRIVEEQPAVLGELHLRKLILVRIGGVGVLFAVVEIERVSVGNGDIVFRHRGVGGGI